jgi:hypothetical protein
LTVARQVRRSEQADGHAGMSLVSKVGVDIFKEFRPRRSK